jgi:hypothetical protein
MVTAQSMIATHHRFCVHHRGAMEVTDCTRRIIASQLARD